jgi:hypothetical protein
MDDIHFQGFIGIGKHIQQKKTFLSIILKILILVFFIFISCGYVIPFFFPLKFYLVIYYFSLVNFTLNLGK